MEKNKSLYKAFKTTHDFRKFKTIQSFGDAIRNDLVTVDVASDEQQQLAKK